MTTDLKTLAEQHATALATLEVAQAAHAEATGRVAAIKTRISELAGRQSDLTARRIAGNGSKNDADELILLAGDLEALNKALADAQQEAASLTPDFAENSAQRTGFALEQATAAARLDLLRQKATECDALLARLLNEIRDAGNGLNLSQLWQPSRALHMTINREYPPV